MTDEPTSRGWTREEAKAIHDLPFNDLIFRAQSVHREHFDPARIQKSRLLSIKTGGWPEDCGDCNRSAPYRTGLPDSKLMEIERVLAEALVWEIKAQGSRELDFSTMSKGILA